MGLNFQVKLKIGLQQCCKDAREKLLGIKHHIMLFILHREQGDDTTLCYILSHWEQSDGTTVHPPVYIALET